MLNLKYYRKRDLVRKTQMTVFSFTTNNESADVHWVIFADKPATKHKHTKLKIKVTS